MSATFNPGTFNPEAFNSETYPFQLLSDYPASQNILSVFEIGNAGLLEALTIRNRGVMDAHGIFKVHLPWADLGSSFSCRRRVKYTRLTTLNLIEAVISVKER